MAAPLFIPASPIAGETLLSLVCRTASANVLARPGAIFELAGVKAPFVVHAPFTMTSAEIMSLAHLLDVTVDEVQHRAHTPISPSSSNQTINWYGTPLEKRFVDWRRRVSPSGLSSQLFIRGSWTLRPITFCAETFESLSDVCSGCSSVLGWRRASALELCDRCGADLRRSKSSKIAPAFREGASVAANLVSPFKEIRAATLATFPVPFSSWMPGQVFAAAADLGAIAAPPCLPAGSSLGRKLARGSVSTVSERQMAAGINLLMDWPNSLVNLLREITINEAAAGVTGKRLIGEFRRYFHQNSPTTPLSLLLREVVPQIARDLAVPLRSGWGTRPVGLRRAKTISAADAVVRFGVNYRAVSRLEGVADCFIAKGSEGGGLRLYNLERLGRSVAAYKAAVRGEDFAAQLGAPAYCLPELERHGLVQRVTDADAQRLAGESALYESTGCEALFELLRCVTHEQIAGGVPTTSVLHRRLDPATWGITIASLANRTLRSASTAAKGGSVLDRLLVDRGEAARFLAELEAGPLPSGVKLSVRSAARLLGVHNVILGAAVEAGLLPRGTRHQPNIPLEALADFTSRYMFAREVAETLPETAGRPKRALEALGISPAVSVGNVSIWRRTEIDGAGLSH